MAALTFDDLDQHKGGPLTFDDLEAPSKGFFGRMGDDFTKRQDSARPTNDAFMQGEIGPLQAGFQHLGQGAGLMGDFAGNVLGSAARYAGDVIPNAIKEPVKNASVRVYNYASDSAAGDVARDYTNSYQGFAQENPNTDRNLAALFNIGGLAASATPIKGVSAASTAVTATKAVTKPVSGAARVIGRAITPSAEEGLIDVASTARKFDIPLSLDQVSGSRALKTAQKVSQDLPFSGQQAFREKQMRAYNKALFKTVGVEADMFTPKSMSMAFGKVGGEFDAVTKGKNFGIGGDFINNLAATAEDVRSQYGDEAFNAFQREAGRVINDFKGDAISGELISRQRGRINALARKAAPGQREALLDLENAIVDGITSGDPVTQAALSQAKQRYKNLIVLEPIANKAKGGMISPSLLNNRVAQVYKRAHTLGNSGDIGDLARVGSELLPELGGSDTAQKAAYIAALSPAGYVAPVTTGLTVGGNRALQAGINRNQGIIDKSIMKAIGKLPPAEAKAALARLRSNPATPIKQVP